MFRCVCICVGGFLVCWGNSRLSLLSWWDKEGYFKGGVTWTGMDSLINNHHPFLPDLKWSHMLSLESRHMQFNSKYWLSRSSQCGCQKRGWKRGKLAGRNLTSSDQWKVRTMRSSLNIFHVQVTFYESTVCHCVSGMFGMLCGLLDWTGDFWVLVGCFWISREITLS